MSANELDLDRWKRQLENSGIGLAAKKAVVTGLKETDTGFTAQAKVTLRDVELEDWFGRLRVLGTIVTGHSLSQTTGGRFTVTADVQRPRAN